VDLANLDDVGRVLTYVAPGFFARVGYTSVFPQRRPEQFYALVVSIAASVPLVALARAMAEEIGLSTRPTAAGFALLLVGLGLLSGYSVARVRRAERTRRFMRWLRLPSAPEATVLERVLLRMPPEAEVTLTFADGRRLAGYPLLGPGFADGDEVRELYLLEPRWWSTRTKSFRPSTPDAGIIVDLASVETISVRERVAASAPSGRLRSCLRL